MTKMQKALVHREKAVRHTARVELAARNPQSRAEIMQGEWDHGQGMLEVRKDMKKLGLT